MAVTITDHRLIANEADSVTNWTGTASVILGTTDPTPIESTGWIGANVGAIIFDGYVTITSDDYSDAVIYAWVFSRLALGNTTDANGGLMILVGDGTNRGAWKVAGADVAPFRHDNGPTTWMCPALDTTSLPASPLSRAGSAASVNFSAITNVGTTVNSLVAAPGMNPTYNMDIIRVLDITDTSFNNCAISITGGTTGARGTFAEIAAADRSTGNQQAHGILRQLAEGAFGCQGPLRFGNATGSSDSWFEDTNAVLVFENRGFRTTLYKIFITDNGTGTTNFILTNCSLIAPTGVGASFDSLTDTDVTAVTVTGTRIDGFTEGVGIGGGTGQVFTNCVFSNGGRVSVTSQSVSLNNSSVLTPTVVADEGALYYDINADPDGELDGMTFTQGTNAHHAIRFGTNVPATMTLRDCTFTGFSSSDDVDGSVFRFDDTTGSITLNLIGCTTDGAFSVDDAAGVTVTVVINPVTTLVNIKDENGDNEAGVSVYLEAADGTGDLPYQQSITSITRSTTTATVTFASPHGLETNEYLKLFGITDKVEDLSGAHQVTVTSTTVLTYQTTDSGSTSYTGTITGTGATIYGTTDASGNISSSRTYTLNQPLRGYARKATTAPFYKSIELIDTVNSTTGLTLNRRLVLDQ